MSTGPAFVIDRLLSRFDLTDTVVFTGEPDRFYAQDARPARSRVEVRRRDVPRWWAQEDSSLSVGGRRIALRLRALGNVMVAARVALEAVGALREERARALLVVYPKQHFLLGGLIAAAFSRKPLLVYFMDVYVEVLPHGRGVARMIERRVLRRASVVFAMSDAHRRQVEERLHALRAGDVRVVELPHPFEAVDVPEAPAPLVGRPAIVFTGSVYSAQADSLSRLIAALDDEALANLDPRLHLFSPMDADAVASFGVRVGGRVSLAFASNTEALAVQRAADILFLPIAFGLVSAQARTASPSKLPEYLAAGRPILVHAPGDSFIACYARKHGFAEVVDEPDAGAVAAAVRRLTFDVSHREKLVRAAGATLARHRADVVAEAFGDAVRDAVGSASAT
jgi:hypothetical protein